MVRPSFLLVLAVLVGACDSEPPRSDPSPAPAPVARRSEPGPAAAPVVASAPQWARSQADDEPEPLLDPAGVLDEEERRLLEADDATLTREDRVARAEAQRKLVMADPEHPLRPTLVRIEAEVASGEARTKAQEMWAGRLAFPDRDESEAPRG